MDLISRWHEALEREPGSPSTFLRQVLASGASYRGQPLCVYRRPHIISGATVMELTRSLSQFHGAVRRIRNVIMEQGLDGELVRSLGLRQGALELARIHPGYESAALVARVDCFVGPDGPKFLELNAESPAGIAYADAGLIELPDGRRAVAGFLVKGPFNDPRSTNLIRAMAAAMAPHLKPAPSPPRAASAQPSP